MWELTKLNKKPCFLKTAGIGSRRSKVMEDSIVVDNTGLETSPTHSFQDPLSTKQTH